uniref:Uncharacterized protein n=1 Tax=Sphaerodactylus townsendi TaxID=933632 RepID=A0ACB8FN02_9SAUR
MSSSLDWTFMAAYTGHNEPNYSPVNKNGVVCQRLARQSVVSLHAASLQLSSSSKENRKHRVAHKGTWNSCHPASPEEQRHSSLSVLRKAAGAVFSSRKKCGKGRGFVMVTEGCNPRNTAAVLLDVVGLAWAAVKFA